MPEWETFFTAQVAASATLVGLLFVGVSLNLKMVLANDGLPDRALAGFYLLLAILVLSSLMLVPGQPVRLIAAEVLVVSITLWLTVTRLAIGSLRRIVAENRHYFVRHLISVQAAVLPYFVGGGLLLAGSQSGMYWIVVAIIVSLFVASFEAWVLLVEINR
jgi:modulator of FtsH protease